MLGTKAAIDKVLEPGAKHTIDNKSVEVTKAIPHAHHQVGHSEGAGDIQNLLNQH